MAQSIVRRLFRTLLIVRMPSASALAAWLGALGPYAAIALLLPGGSLVALVAWLVQRRGWSAADLRRGLVIAAALSGLLIFPTGV